MTENFICGNFSQRDGGGIGHLGLSDQGLIADNVILFNENFNQGRTVSGGGISIAGAPPLGTDVLSPGSGSVTVTRNRIQGNLAGAGDGGGMHLKNVNGEDVATSPGKGTGSWYVVDVTNNMIVNNVAALAGGGISLQESARIRIIHNTVAHNDSTATASTAFTPADPNQSVPQPAGIVARVHSTALANAVQGKQPARYAVGYPNPDLEDNVIWQNRSFSFFGDLSGDTPVYGLLPDVTVDPPVYDDLAVLGTAAPECLEPVYSVLGSLVGPRGCDYTGNGNLSSDPDFVAEYFNGDRDATIAFPEGTTALQVPPAFDEGGNFIRVRYGPLTEIRLDTGEPYGDYHIQSGSPAVNAGSVITTLPELATDFDGEPRPDATSGLVDIGADEAAAAEAAAAATASAETAAVMALATPVDTAPKAKKGGTKKRKGQR